MSFAVKTNFTIVVQEGDSGGMVLPWQKGMICEDSTARIGGGSVPSGTDKLTVVFAGITTLTTLFFAPEVAMEVRWGSPDAAPMQVEAGGVVGFTKGNMPADEALTVSYTGEGGAAGGFCVVWGGH